MFLKCRLFSSYHTGLFVLVHKVYDCQFVATDPEPSKIGERVRHYNFLQSNVFLIYGILTEVLLAI